MTQDEPTSPRRRGFTDRKFHFQVLDQDAYSGMEWQDALKKLFIQS